LQIYMRFALGVARGKYMIVCLNFVADTWVHCLCSYCKFLLCHFHPSVVVILCYRVVGGLARGGRRIGGCLIVESWCAQVPFARRSCNLWYYIYFPGGKRNTKLWVYGTRAFISLFLRSTGRWSTASRSPNTVAGRPRVDRLTRLGRWYSDPEEFSASQVYPI
jgi:hypothetical protein